MLKVAAVVVGVAAVVLTAGAALGLIPAVLGTVGGLTITATGLAAVLGVTATALNVAAGLTAPKPSFGQIAGSGTQLDFVADPNAGLPYAMGFVRTGASIVHEASWGDKNRYLGLVCALTCAGPIPAAPFHFYGDNTSIDLTSVNAVGYYHNFMYGWWQLGARPEASALPMTAPNGTVMPDWGADHKLSSIAAMGLILVADVDNGKIYSGGVPQFTFDFNGPAVYDPRQDSTNGGTGSQRALNEATYVYSANPWAHHGTYALGRWVNGVKVIGPGLPVASIDWPSQIEAANIADANGWTISGRVLSTDNKWDVLRSIAQAGGGYPIPTQAKLSCLVNTPRVSLETIEEEHVKGAVSAPQMAMRRDRLNGAVPRYREPSLGWQVVSGGVVRNATYLTADGGAKKTKEIDLPLVTDKDQAAQLVAYEVANSRERSPIQVPLDLYWSQYKTGDCLTLNLPSALLFNQKCIVIGRDIDAESGIVTFTFRTEDDAKHTWALGVTGTAPPSTTVGSSAGAGDSGPTLTQAQVTQLIASSYTIPSQILTVHSDGTVDVINHQRAYSDKSINVQGATGIASGGTAGQVVGVYYDDPNRVDTTPTPPTYHAVAATGGVPSSCFASSTYPYRHFCGSGTIPSTGTTSGSGPSPTGNNGSGGGVLP